MRGTPGSRRAPLDRQPPVPRTPGEADHSPAELTAALVRSAEPFPERSCVPCAERTCDGSGRIVATTERDRGRPGAQTDRTVRTPDTLTAPSRARFAAEAASTPGRFGSRE